MKKQLKHIEKDGANMGVKYLIVENCFRGVYVEGVVGCWGDFLGHKVGGCKRHVHSKSQNNKIFQQAPTTAPQRHLQSCLVGRTTVAAHCQPIRPCAPEAATDTSREGVVGWLVVPRAGASESQDQASLHV